MVSSVASFFSSLLLFCLAIQSRTLLCSSECICLYVWLQICVCAFVQAVGSAKERGGQVGEKKKKKSTFGRTPTFYKTQVPSFFLSLDSKQHVLCCL